MAKSPTAWTVNPLASTADLINYDDATLPYDSTTHPYDGTDNNPSLTSWKNPTTYTIVQGVGSVYQQYYGGPTEVPLWAGPAHWVPNPGEVNQSGQYVERNSAEADLDIYDNTTDSYNGNNATVSPNYDSINPSNSSFASWKNPSQWTPITGGSF